MYGKLDGFPFSLDMKELTLTHGKIALLDNEDFERLKEFNYSYRPIRGNNSTENVFRNIPGGGTQYLQHDVLGDVGRVKYLDGNRLNFQKANLITVDISATQQGVKRVTKGKTSRFVGVSWHKKRERWRATISHNKKQIDIGFFETEIEAAEAYNKKAVEIFGEFANLNDIAAREIASDDIKNNIEFEKLLPRSKKSRKDKTSYRGVSYKGDNLKKPWMAMIKHESIGYFETPEDAAMAYNRAAKKLYGKRAILNKLSDMHGYTKSREKLIGKKFSRLTITKIIGRSKYDCLEVECICDCGNTINTLTQYLNSGNVRSCGCLLAESSSENIKKAANKLAAYYVDGTNLLYLSDKPTARNTSGVRGVTWDKSRDRWNARIGIQGKQINLGYFEEKIDAIQVRKRAEEKYFSPILEKYQDLLEGENKNHDNL